MIQEAYCSFEVSKFLKEKGFNTPVWTRYENNDDDDNKVIFGDKYNWNNSLMGQISAPTLQMAMAWLREVHNIQIELNWDKGNQLYSFQIWKLGKYQLEISSLDLWRIYKDNNYLGEWNYEETVEEALKYCLEHLIK